MALLRTLLLGATLAVLPAAAETADRPARTPQELDRIKGDIDAAERQRAADETNRAKANTDLLQLQDEAARSAADIQRLERDADRTDRRISDLALQDKTLTAKLAARRSEVEPLLAALQRLRRDPPPALAVTPDDAIAAARGAMLIAAVAGKLEAEARSLATDLHTLADNRTALTKERDVAAAHRRELTARRIDLDLLIKRRQQIVADLDLGLVGAAAHITDLKTRADDMTALMAWLDKDAAARPADKAGALATAPVTVGRAGSESHFMSSRGHLKWPAAGAIATKFGDAGTGGEAAHGVTLKTRGAAQVTAPADGEIVFAGTFGDYGRLLILSPGEGYFILIGGFARLDAVVGQHVLSGEPLGIMAGSGGNAEGSMYIEVRHSRDPIDPLPWFESVDASG